MLIPKDNERDLADIPASVVKHLEIIGVGHMDEVVKHAIMETEDKPLYNHAFKFENGKLDDSDIAVVAPR